MLETRSAIFKMLQPLAHEERRISKWPPPYSTNITSYKDRDFNFLVRKSSSAIPSTPKMAKVIVLGDLAVGKTSLVNRFCHKTYSNNYKPTIGVDFEVERFDILEVPFNLQIWDTAGQERFKAIAASYYRGANVIMIIFDLGNLLSLSHCQKWLNEASQCNTDGYYVFLVGAKKDLISRESYAIMEKKATAVAESLKAEYWAVSAKMGDGVLELFTRVAALSFNSAMMRELAPIKAEFTTVGSELVTLKRVPTSGNVIKKTKKKQIKWSICNTLL